VELLNDRGAGTRRKYEWRQSMRNVLVDRFRNPFAHPRQHSRPLIGTPTVAVIYLMLHYVSAVTVAAADRAAVESANVLHQRRVSLRSQRIPYTSIHKLLVDDLVTLATHPYSQVRKYVAFRYLSSARVLPEEIFF
jgi:hypothetical protein